MLDFADAGYFAGKLHGYVQFLALVLIIWLKVLKFQIRLNSAE